MSWWPPSGPCADSPTYSKPAFPACSRSGMSAAAARSGSPRPWARARSRSPRCTRYWPNSRGNDSTTYRSRRTTVTWQVQPDGYSTWALPTNVTSGVYAAPGRLASNTTPHRSVGPEPLAHHVELLRCRQLPQAVRQRVAFANAVVPHRPHVEPPQLEDQEHLGGPPSDTTDDRQAGDELLVGEPAEAM